jgi:hypothetical protein
MLTKEDYQGAGILDKDFKLDSRETPLFQSEGMEFLWDPDFTVEAYVGRALARIRAHVATDSAFKAKLLKAGKIREDAELDEAIQKLVYFDANCAQAIRDTMTHDEFQDLHRHAANAIPNTIASILEELSDPETVFMLQELNEEVIAQHPYKGNALHLEMTQDPFVV